MRRSAAVDRRALELAAPRVDAARDAGAAVVVDLRRSRARGAPCGVGRARASATTVSIARRERDDRERVAGRRAGRRAARAAAFAFSIGSPCIEPERSMTIASESGGRACVARLGARDRDRDVLLARREDLRRRQPRRTAMPSLVRRAAASQRGRSARRHQKQRGDDGGAGGTRWRARSGPASAVATMRRYRRIDRLQSDLSCESD